MTPEQCAEFLGIKINTLYVMKSQGGKGETERIKRIITFAGQSLKGPEGSAVLFKLSDTAKDQNRPGSPEPVSAKGRAQAVAFKCGKGRVVVLGEAAMMSAGLCWRMGKRSTKSA